MLLLASYEFFLFVNYKLNQIFMLLTQGFEIFMFEAFIIRFFLLNKTSSLIDVVIASWKTMLRPLFSIGWRTYMLRIRRVVVINPLAFCKQRWLLNVLAIIFIWMVIVGSILIVLSVVIRVVLWNMHLFLLLSLVSVFFVVD